MWGIVPAAGRGSRIQPLGFSKELLPLSGQDGEGGSRPCAVGAFAVERMVLAGADKICIVIAPGKYDIIDYFSRFTDVDIAYVVQPEPTGLCDALFRATSLIGRGEPVVVGLPDTVWFPRAGFGRLPGDKLAFLLFPVAHPQHFDAVVLDGAGLVREVQVKQAAPATNWIWGAFSMPGTVFHDLAALWQRRQRADEYFGTLVNAYIAAGGMACGVKAGETYADVGTFDGYLAALEIVNGLHRGGLPREPGLGLQRSE